MPMQVTIPVSIPAGQQMNASWGSLFHGALMELFPPEMASELHHSTLKPWSQYLSVSRDGKIRWVLNTLSDEMTESVEKYLIGILPCNWILKQKGFAIRLDVPERIEKISYRELADQTFSRKETARRTHLIFQVPTTFKTAGDYVLFPSMDLIFNSLAQKWDAFSSEISISDMDVRQHLGSHIQIRKYQLRSAPFSVDGAWITGFEGRLELSFRGPEALCRVADLLLHFGKYSGVGIKTALGMGGIEYEESRFVLSGRHDGSVS